MGKTSCKKGQYYCNTDKKCKPIPDGYKVREDGFLVSEGSNPRIARKKGQPAKSKKHSDLYTDEDPKGTIHGLGFKDVATAKASVAKIRKSSRSHAHKIQAAIAMEQRARVMGKTAEAAVYRKFINSMKKKTKAMNEEKHGDHEYEMIRRQTDNIMVAAKKLKKKFGKGEGNVKAWVQSKITKAADYLDTASDYETNEKEVKEGTLRDWFGKSKSKDGKPGWVQSDGSPCANEPGETKTPKCYSSAKRASMSKKELRSADARKSRQDPGQQQKRNASSPTYVKTDKPKPKKKMKEEFISLPLQLEVPQNDGEFKLGLMFRESLEQDRGMLFVFENTDNHSFHMKNTFIPLDIAFINEEGIIESIKELDPMNPIPVYPDGNIRYAVEVNRGWFAENGVVVGDILLEDIEEAEIITEVKDKKGKGSGTKDACYHKVKSRYSVWPSAYASGALVKCRKVGAANWGNSKKEEVEYEVNEDKTPRSVVDKDYLEKIKQGGREYEITKDMSDREYKKHLKKTGNFRKSGGDYNYSHHKDDAYKDKAKRYDDRIDASVKDALDKKQAQRDKIEKERKERSGPYGNFKQVAPNLKMSTPKVIKREFKAIKKEHYGYEINEKDEGFNTTGVKGITKKDDKVFHNGRQLSQYGIKQLNVKDGAFSEKGKRARDLKNLQNRLNEKKKIDYSEYPELVAQGRGGKTANVDVEPAALKTYRNVRTVASLLPSVGKRLLGDKDAFKKQEKAERKRYKNPQGIERVVTGIADKMTGDKYDFDRKGPSKTKKEHYDWRSTLDEKCWAGYEKKGMKTMFGKRYPNCVKKSKKKK